ncbi:DUF6153 family protein [Cnuibacter physcomitrellae]|uniref:DUF6153 family protein n=1 Tax=Cnuibacter physcomitrellae TaxID=1619308 RepID=UPI0012F511FD|nr:DUF6153 family protein [Cnuibacter physcomitrellae]
MRAAILRPTALQRTVLLLGVVLAIVAGLLAMHTIATGMTGHGDPGTAAMTVTDDHRTDPTHPVPMEHGCADCAPSHDMTVMVCVLALLVGTVLILPGLLHGIQPHARSAVRSSLLGAAVRSAAFRDPPDLLKLSISRT